MKALKKISAFLLAAALVCGLAPLSACGKEPGYEWVRREERPVQTTDYSGTTALPRARGETSKTVQYLKMDGQSNNDLFFALSLQGNVNREDPSMYLIRDEVVENLAGINSSQFWFDRIDTDVYTLEEQDSVYRMLVDNLDRVSGYILYDARLADSKMSVSPVSYGTLYGDNALLNLTVMLCAQKNAVALTREQLYILHRDYGINADEEHVDLPRLGDTTQFMLKDGEGNLLSTDEARGSREVWQKVYDYALKYVAPDMSDSVMAHGPAFQAACFDYFIQNKVFLYNRILDNESTAREKQTETDIFAVTKPNTPMMGVQYLQLDEHSLIPAATRNHKFSVCAYETFNLSWTSGLPVKELPKPESRELVYDENKIYVSFDFSEGDNYSYQSMRVPLMGDNSQFDIPIGWPVSSTLYEIMPNVVEYFAETWGKYDSAVCPEAGPGYVFTTPPASSRDDFFALTSEYLRRNGTDAIRMLKGDMVDPLPYAEGVEGLNAMLIGYMGELGSMWNTNENANFLYRDTVFFRHYDGTVIEQILDYNGGYPAFFAVGLYGWNQDVATVKTLADSFDSRFELVTPSELAQLYKQYAAKKFRDITHADVVCDGGADEMGFLNFASDHYAVETGAGGSQRMADGKDFFTYRFDLADDTETAEVFLNLAGRYEIEISKDNLNFAKVLTADGYYEEAAVHRIDVTRFLRENPTKTVYVRVGDATPENDGGAVLRSVSVSTDRAASGELTLTSANDGAYLVSNASTTVTKGRKGEFTYRLKLDEGMTEPLLTVGKTERAGSVKFSRDNGNFVLLDAKFSLASSDVYELSSMLADNPDRTVFVKFEGSAVVTSVKLTQLKKVTEASFTANGTGGEAQYLLSGDDTPARAADSIDSYRSFGGGNALLYGFVPDAGITSLRLDLRITGNYKVSAAKSDGVFRELTRVTTGSTAQRIYVDAAGSFTAGEAWYVRVELLEPNSDKAVRLYGVRLFTNLASDSLTARYEREREPDFTLAPMLGAQKEDDDRFWTSDPNSGEYRLIDKALSGNEDHVFKNGNLNMRCLKTSDSVLVYKLDFRTENAAFWLAPESGTEGFDITQGIAKLRVDVDIAENYKLELSSDGETWTTVGASALPSNYGGGATNRKKQPVSLTEAYKTSPVIYLRISSPAETSYTALISGLSFYFN